VSFRRRLLLLFAVTVLVSVAAVSAVISVLTRRAFDRANDQRTAALVGQFRREFDRIGQEISRKLQAIASAPDVSRMSLAMARAAPDYSSFLDTAQVLAGSQRLDFLEFTDDRGTIISSAQWPAKFGYSDPIGSQAPSKSFLKAEELPLGTALGLFSVLPMATGDRRLFAIGGVRLDKNFLANVELPQGMRVLIYEVSGETAITGANMIYAGEPLRDSRQLAPLIDQVRRSGAEASRVIHWPSGDEETVNAFPLTGINDQLLAVLLVGSSRQEYLELRRRIRSAATLASGAGLLLAIILSSWISARVTRPVEELARAAHEVAGGNWNTEVSSSSADEIGELAESFNRMTRELLSQQERLVQVERVAAWRELARRLAHELKNPLFPLQLTVENLLRAREQGQQQFDELFRESAPALLAEIANLKAIINRFSEFSRMPQPQFRPVRLDQIVQEVATLHQAQLANAKITCKLELDAGEEIAADSDLLHRVLSNLVLNAIDAMPQGGTLTIQTSQRSGSATIQVTDTGVGLTREECDRLFTPYYTSKAHGTGLGLAIVQSIVSDHGGKITVSSEPGRGATFIIELPANHDRLGQAEKANG